METLTRKNIIDLNKKIGERGVEINNTLHGIIYSLNRYEPTIEGYATKLIYDLITLHPFLEGNKRTAFYAFIAFLKANGYKLRKNYKYAPKINRILHNIVNGKAKEAQVKRMIEKMRYHEYKISI